jgi:putative transposase
MGRIARVYMEKTYYHLYTRGNRKESIFLDEEDFEYYLSVTGKAKERYGIRLYCYCLMPNHVHLLIKPEEAKNISKFMHWTNRAYSGYFNKKYEKVGHLWQGRFQSKPVLKESYLVNLADYIEHNPVRAKIVKYAGDYKWSSYTQRCLHIKSEFLSEFDEAALVHSNGTL